MPSVNVRAVLAAVVVVGCGAPAVQAGFPPLEVQWILDGSVVLDDLPFGVPSGTGGFRYDGGGTFGAVSMSYSLVGTPDPRISSSFALQNFSLATVEVVLQVTLPISPALLDSTSLTGSVAVGMTADDDGGTLAALAGIPFWQGLLDGIPVGGATDLLIGLNILIAGPGSPDGAEEGFFQVAGPSVLETIGIRISFSLTPGEQVSFTSVFDVVPGPGGLAVVLFAAVLTRRRRRSG